MVHAAKFLLVDDDPINNSICQAVIRSVYPDANIITFEKPEEALQFVTHSATELLPSTTLFLDLNMPELSGWEFLDELKKINIADVLKSLRIYIVSSSVDGRDKSKAAEDSSVIDFFSKPVTKDIVRTVGNAMNG